MEITLGITPAAEGLFAGWDETIIWSCLQKVMGCVYANGTKNPTAAAALLGDFGFLAGQADTDFLLALKKDVCRKNFIILVPQNTSWNAAIEACYGDDCRRVTRYAFQKGGESFDPSKLERLAGGLPAEYRLTMINRQWYACCQKTHWCRDLVAQYKSFEEYAKWGLGVLVLRGSVPVSGASSYSSYRFGIEVEIDTRQEYRRKGLAAACGARLILECLKRNLYPSWDAQNAWSAALAQKLGYRFSHEYTAYEAFCSRAEDGGTGP